MPYSVFGYPSVCVCGKKNKSGSVYFLHNYLIFKIQISAEMLVSTSRKDAKIAVMTESYHAGTR
ncbi:MAG: hypothetical protein BWK80_46490 [Desulfobacteraceae bacterium IS3]|nr:MAG: hypothetical protein BWK80_46490 [Desulfobacteraceae bacterium IS3]